MKYLNALALVLLSFNFAASGQHTGIGGGNAFPSPPPPPPPRFSTHSLVQHILDLIEEDETEGEAKHEEKQSTPSEETESSAP